MILFYVVDFNFHNPEAVESETYYLVSKSYFASQFLDALSNCFPHLARTKLRIKKLID